VGHVPAAMIITTAMIAAFLAGAASYGSLEQAVREVRRKANKLSASGYDALDPKKKLEALPELKRFSKGAKTYRDAGDEPMRCHRCERPCIYCKRLNRLKRTGR